MEPSITHVYCARNNILAILEESGYDVTDYNNVGIQQVSAMLETNQLDMILTHPSNKKIFVKFHLDTKLNVNTVANQFFDDDAILTKNDDLMIIVKADPNETITSAMDSLWNDSKIYLSVINIKRLQFNILNHIQVPKHEILSPDEKSDLFLKLHIKKDIDLPLISRYDPVATVLCMRPGMVCRIHRKSKTAVTNIYYRACV